MKNPINLLFGKRAKDESSATLEGLDDIQLENTDDLNYTHSKGNFAAFPNAYFWGRWFSNGDKYVTSINQGSEMPLFNQNFVTRFIFIFVTAFIITYLHDWISTKWKAIRSTNIKNKVA